MARRDVNDGSYMYLSKVPRFPSQKRLHNEGQLNLATDGLKGFSSGVFSRLCITHIKNSNNGNLEPKSKLIIIFFFMRALKAKVFNLMESIYIVIISQSKLY